MIVYFDTSALLPILIEEPSSGLASRLWDEADRVVSSSLVYVEGRAALAMARRMDRITARQLRTAVNGFEGLHQQIDMVGVTSALVKEAGDAAERLGLRGYDAVHLASAQLVNDPEMVFATGDRRLREAASSAGMATAQLHSTA